MATMTRYDKNDPDPFLTEARAQLAKSRSRGRQGLARLAVSIVLLVLAFYGVWPWATFIGAMIYGTMAIYDAEAWMFGRKAAVIAMQFRSGIED